MYTRNTIIDSILKMRAKLKRIGDRLEISLLDSKSEVSRMFEANVSNLDKKDKTFYKVASFLNNNPEVRLISESTIKFQTTRIEV